MKAKQMARWTGIVVFVLGARLAAAQPGGDFGGDFGGGMPPFPGEEFQRQQIEKPDNTEAAKQLTDEMQGSLALTGKQYKKVYKLNLKWLDNLSSPSGTGSGRPSSPMGEGLIDGEGLGGGERYGNLPDSPDDTSESGRQFTVREATDEELAARDAKLKKILTAEQYCKWLETEARRRNQVRCHEPADRCAEQ